MSFMQIIYREFDFNLYTFIFDVLIPSILAIIFGGLIGFQRETHERPAGLRTHALVCLGATVFTLISYTGFPQSDNLDPSRIAAGVVTGIGFIGAGAILKRGTLVKGVTTAASIWTSAAIGLALGTKLYYLAAVVTIIGLVILSLLKYLESRVIHAPLYVIKVTTGEDLKKPEELKAALNNLSTEVKSKKYEIIPETGEKIYSFHLHSREDDLPGKVIERLSKKPGVLKISVN